MTFSGSTNTALFLKSSLWGGLVTLFCLSLMSISCSEEKKVEKKVVVPVPTPPVQPEPAPKEPQAENPDVGQAQETQAVVEEPPAPKVKKLRKKSVKKSSKKKKKNKKSKGGAGKISTAGVIKAIKANKKATQSCYNRQLKSNSSSVGAGVVNIRYTINEEGKVVFARVNVNTTGSRAVGSCVAGVIKGIQFPKPTGGNVTMEAPFRFKPGNF